MHSAANSNGFSCPRFKDILEGASLFTCVSSGDRLGSVESYSLANRSGGAVEDFILLFGALNPSTRVKTRIKTKKIQRLAIIIDSMGAEK